MASAAGYIFNHSAKRPNFTEILPYYSNQFVDLVRNAEQVLKNAQLARSSHEKFGDAWARACDLVPDSHVVMGPPKELGRLIEKAIARYNGDPFQVSDACRSRILVDSPEEVKGLRHAITSTDFRKAATEKGIDLLDPIEDYFAMPTETGWRALVIKSKINIGKGRTQLAETVVMPRAWVDDYEKSHQHLEKIRSIKDKARTEQRTTTRNESFEIILETQKALMIHAALPSREAYLSLETKIAKPKLAAIRGKNIPQFEHA